MLAAVVTSLLRRHLSRKAWRAVHLTAYVSWPVAWLHSVFSSGDLQHGLLFFLAIVCALAVIAAALWRVAAAGKDVPRAERVGLLMSAVHSKAQRRQPDGARRGKGRSASDRRDRGHQGRRDRAAPPAAARQENKKAHDWHAHADRHGRLPYRDRQGVLIRDIEAAGLTGRGGAAFPVHRKLQAVLDAADKRRRTPAVIANGAESEPASDKDATLLWLSPHLVLDGLQLAAEAVGADTAILYTHVNREHDVGGRLQEALQARQAAGVDRVPVQLAQAPARFLSGQETALVNHLSGGPAIPTFMPPRITERGLNGVPTLVQNAETLAHLALIARKGPRWFRERRHGRRARLDARHHPPRRRPAEDQRDAARHPAAGPDRAS